MKKNSIQLSIPEPCHENWSEMTPTEQGRHCKSCDKILTDFTKLSDQQMLNYFKNYNGKLCGRFKKSQIERPIIPLPTPSFSRSYAASGLLAAGLLLGGDVIAQQTPTNENTVIEQTIALDCVAPILGKVAINQSQKTPFTIKGKVLDNESGEALIGCMIFFPNPLNEEENIGTITEIDGSFVLEIPAEHRGKTLKVHSSYAGYEDSILDLIVPMNTNEKVWDVEMQMGEILMGEIVCYLPSQPLTQQWRAIKKFPRRVAYWVGRTYEDTVGYFSNKKEARKAKKEEKIANKEIKKTTLQTKEIIPQTPIQKTITKPTVVQKVFPNPAFDYLMVELETKSSQEIHFQLVNVIGKLMYEEKIKAAFAQNTHEINLPSGLTAGVYFLKTITENGDIETYQLVIEKP